MAKCIALVVVLVALCCVRMSMGVGMQVISSFNFGSQFTAAAHSPAKSIGFFGNAAGSVWGFNYSTDTILGSMNLNSRAVRNIYVDHTPRASSGLTRMAYMCNSQSVYVADLNKIEANQGLTPYVRYTPADTIQSCNLDLVNGFAYITRRANWGITIVIEKVRITPENPSWNEGQRQSARWGESFSSWQRDWLNFAEGVTAVDYTNMAMYFASTGSPNLIRVALDATSAVNTRVTALDFGAGNYLALGSFGPYLFLGSDIGLGLIVQGANMDITDVFFTNDGQLRSVILDAVNGVTFWGTTRVNGDDVPKILRINADYGKVNDQVTTAVDDIRSGWIDTARQVGYFASFSGTNTIYKVKLAECSNFTNCLECTVGDPKYCGWCYQTARCTVNGNCTGEFETNQSQCPLLLDIQPKSGSVAGFTNVTIRGSRFLQSTQTQCYFGSTVSPSTRVINSTHLSCTAPSAGAGVSDVRVFYINPWASNTVSYTYYECNPSTSLGCSECIAFDKPECSWCLTDSSCKSSYLCSTTANVSQVLQCPSFALQPLSSSSGGNVNINITGGIFVQSTAYRIVLTSSSNAVIQNVSATWVSDKLMTAVIPATSVGEYTVTLYTGGKRYVYSTAKFTFYDCEAEASCVTCKSAVKPDCVWCQDEPKCTYAAVDCLNSATVESCPQIDYVDPASSFIDGGVDVSVKVSGYFPPGEQYRCQFATNVFVNATVGTGGRFICKAPALTAGTYYINLWKGDTPYTDIPGSAFLYFDCREQKNCSSCLSPLLSATCLWCLPNSCEVRATSTCTADLKMDTCPAVVEMIPPAAFVRELTFPNITVVGNNFYSGGDYSCQFGNVSVPAELLNSTTLSCQAPVFDIPNQETLLTIDFSVYDGSVVYTLNNFTFSYYDCLLEWDDCDQCVVNQYCGWCLPTSNCIPQQYCDAGNDTWMWSEHDCPVITSVTPNHGLIEGDTEVTVKGTLFLDDPFLLQCQFGQIVVNATVTDQQTLICTTPSSSSVSAVDLRILYRERNFTSNTAAFAFIDCLRYATCTSCSTDRDSGNRCGWCLHQAECVPNFMCQPIPSDLPSMWVQTQCPLILSMSPGIGSLGGGTNITITGNMFVNDNSLTVKFGGVDATQVVFINSSHIMSTSPASVDNAPKEIDVSVELKSRIYTSNSYKWNYVDASASSGTTDSVKEEEDDSLVLGMAIGFSLFGLCMLASIIGFFLWHRKKQRQGQILLVDPKYDQIAFSNFLSPLYEKKHGALEPLEELVLAPDKTFVVALGNVTQATETDNLARALVYVYEGHNKTLDLILTFIDLELARSSEATLFRNNSIVTKMFKFYSRMIGVSYLFTTLARYIAELEASSKRSEKGEEDPNSILSGSIEMEVDPSKMGEEEDENVNKLQLMLVVQKIFNSIMKSSKNIPPPLLAVCGHVKRAVSAQIPGAEYKAVSAFLFLRFICPALAAPHAYGLLPDPPSANTQRHLVLLSKVLQTLANGQRLGNKEAFMAKLNDFIDDNLLTLQNFYDKMAIPSSFENFEGHDVPKVVRENSLIWIHNHVNVNLSKLNNELETQADFDNGKEIKNKLEQVLNDLGPVPEKLK